MRVAALFALLAIALAADSSPFDYLRDKFYTLEEDLWKNVTDPAWSDAGLGGDVEMTKAFVRFDEQIETAQQPPRLPLQFWLWVKASEKMNAINSIYKSFIVFVKRQAVPGAVPSPVREWLDLAETVLMDPKTSVSQLVRKLDELLEHGDMFRAALQGEHPDLCELQLSPHQIIYDMYNTITLTEIKGYAMMQFSWMLLRIYGKGNFTQEASLTRQRYTERSARTASAARAALAMARRDLYRCDPPEHKEGETFAQVTRLLQGYIENEVDMNTEGTCKENCPHYTLAKSEGCFKEQFCSKQPQCKGRIIDCQYIDSDMWVCPASRSSNRRYEWIEYENGRTLGRVGSCSRGTTKVDSWWRWLFWHCSYCLCLCDETGTESHRYFSLWATTSDIKNNKLVPVKKGHPHPFVDSWWKWNLLHCSYCFCLCEDDIAIAERFFSMREALADHENNKVVTGVRLVKQGRMFHLQISEGVLGERGSIVSTGWEPIPKFDPSDPGVVENVDYHTLTYEKRAIDLDELDSPAGYILTGVRFRMIGPNLHFEIRSTPFNYTSGRMFPERSQWISNDKTEGQVKPRTQLQLQRPDVPTRSRAPLPVDSQHDQYVEFTHTDLDADAAQTTVPFIDIQPVQPMKGSALVSGAGVIHRGVAGSGGFIALKLFTYDYSKHVKADTPPSMFEEDGETTEFIEFMPEIN